MDDRIDLSALDPAADPARFERLLSAVAADAVQARAARGPVPPTLLDLVSWTRPLLAVAATIAVVAGAALVSLRRSGAAPESLAESVGIPRAVAEWAAQGEHPPAAALIAAFASVPRAGRTATEQP
jgi:hypothetical protein